MLHSGTEILAEKVQPQKAGRAFPPGPEKVSGEDASKGRLLIASHNGLCKCERS